MRVVIVRHGQAEHHTRPDEARHLDAVGETEARQAGAFIARLQPDHLWISPYQRTQETAELLLEELSECSSELSHELKAELTPDADPRALINLLLDQVGDEECVVLVSHMPMVACLHGLLVEGALAGGKRFKTGQVRVLDAEFAGLGQFEQTAKFSR